MSTPPRKKNLTIRIEKARAELVELEAARKAAWLPPPAQRLPCLEWECDWAPKNYHMAFQRWQLARDHLESLERELRAS